MEIFEKTIQQAENIEKKFNNFFLEFIRVLGKQDTEEKQKNVERYAKELQELSDKLKEAKEELIEKLNNPTLIIATIGTTSSGKSTLINFLCGAKILPVNVQEKTAGIVIIEDNDDKSLTIKKLIDNQWEEELINNCDDKIIYSVLNDVMDSHTKDRETNPLLEPPRMNLKYPIKFLRDYCKEINVPINTKIKLLDLPGFAYIGDTNLSIIKEEFNQGLGLFIYNGEFTPQNMEQDLLEQLTFEVKSLGVSLDRMLFVINKIDAFNKDNSNPQQSQDQFVEEKTRKIKGTLQSALQSYSSEIENLKILRLSSGPAMNVTIMMQENVDTTDKIKFAKLTSDNYGQLIDEKVVENLAMSPKRWSDKDYVRVAESVLKNSYAHIFLDVLKRHIEEHFPSLVIPQAIKEFKNQAGYEVTQWATREINAILNSAEENYQRECENIKKMRDDSEEIVRKCNKKLDFLGTISEKLKEGEELENWAEILEVAITDGISQTEPYKDNPNKFSPLYQWEFEFGKAVEKMLDIKVMGSFKETNVDLTLPYINEYGTVYKELKSSITNIKNYSQIVGFDQKKYAYSGEKALETTEVIARRDDNKRALETFYNYFETFFTNLNYYLQEGLETIAQNEQQQVNESVNFLFETYLSDLRESINQNEQLKNLQIEFSENQFKNIEKQFDFGKFEFKSPIDRVNEKTRVGFLWLRKGDKIILTIPPIDRILSDFKEQLSAQKISKIKYFADWLDLNINNLKERANEIAYSTIDTYKVALDKAYEENLAQYNKDQELWSNLQTKTQNMSEELNNLTWTNLQSELS